MGESLVPFGLTMGAFVPCTTGWGTTNMTAPLGTWVPMNTMGWQRAGCWLGVVLGTTAVTTLLFVGSGTIWQITGTGGAPLPWAGDRGAATPGCSAGSGTDSSLLTEGFVKGTGPTAGSAVLPSATDSSLVSAPLGARAEHTECSSLTFCFLLVSLEALSWYWSTLAALTGQVLRSQSWASAVWRITLVTRAFGGLAAGGLSASLPGVARGGLAASASAFPSGCVTCDTSKSEGL